MAKTNEALQIELLEQIKRLLTLTLSEQGVKGKRIAEVIGVDPASSAESSPQEEQINDRFGK